MVELNAKKEVCEGGRGIKGTVYVVVESEVGESGEEMPWYFGCKVICNGEVSDGREKHCEGGRGRGQVGEGGEVTIKSTCDRFDGELLERGREEVDWLLEITSKREVDERGREVISGMVILVSKREVS